MDWVDALGHVAYALLFGGVILIGQKRAIGWLFYLIGDLMWLGLGWELGLTSIVFWQAAFLVLAAYNWRRWRSEVESNAWTQWTAPRESSGSSRTPASADSGMCADGANPSTGP